MTVEPEVGQVLSLISLAKSEQRFAVPGSNLEVLSVPSRQTHELSTSLWLSVLEGDLIIDLPHGDFRTLKPGDCLSLPAGITVHFEPLEFTVVLVQAGA